MQNLWELEIKLKQTNIKIIQVLTVSQNGRFVRKKHQKYG